MMYKLKIPEDINDFEYITIVPDVDIEMMLPSELRKRKHIDFLRWLLGLLVVSAMYRLENQNKKRRKC